jgi:hypothetical protein
MALSTEIKLDFVCTCLDLILMSLTQRISKSKYKKMSYQQIKEAGKIFTIETNLPGQGTRICRPPYLQMKTQILFVSRSKKVKNHTHFCEQLLV